MKSKIAFILLSSFILACTKENYEDTLPSSSTDDVFILKNCFVDTASIEEVDLDDDDIDRFNFQISLEHHTIRDYDFVHNDFIPNLTGFANQGVLNIILNPESNSFSTINDESPSEPSSYTHLILMNPESESNMMYFGRLGFFLEQHIADINENSIFKSELIVGFANGDQVEFIEDDIMPLFYEKTDSVSNKVNTNHPIISATSLLNRIDMGLKRLLTSSKENKQLTVLNYALVDTTFMDYALLDSVTNQLVAQNINLNIISLLPVDFLMQATWKTNGFYETDISYISSTNNNSTLQIEIESYLEKRIFSSSYTLQNIDKLISGQAKKFTRHVFDAQLDFFDEDDIEIDDVIEMLESQFFSINWEHPEPHFPLQFNITPEIVE